MEEECCDLRKELTEANRWIKAKCTIGWCWKARALKAEEELRQLKEAADERR